MNEIEEFYSYVEMPQAAENLRAWEGSFDGGAFELVRDDLRANSVARLAELYARAAQDTRRVPSRELGA